MQHHATKQILWDLKNYIFYIFIMNIATELCIQSRGPHCLLSLIPECKQTNTKPEWLLWEENEAARKISTHKQEVEDLKEIIEHYKTNLEHIQNQNLLQEEDGDEFNGWYYKEESKNNIVEKITYLNCVYSEKDIVKKLGAKWDKEKKKWYCPNYIDPIIFQKWIPNMIPYPSVKETIIANKMLKKLSLRIKY